MPPETNLYFTYFFALADPFPVVLRALSTEYLARAHARLMQALASAGQHQTDWRFGWVHPGFGAVPGFDPARDGSPLTFVGWISRDAYGAVGSEQDARFEQLGAALSRGTPALRWGATSSRAFWFDIPPDAPAAALAAVIEHATNDPTEWSPEALAALGLAPDEPLSRCVHALLAHDETASRAALAAAAETYSEAGMALLRAGLGQLAHYAVATR